MPPGHCFLQVQVPRVSPCSSPAPRRDLQQVLADGDKSVLFPLPCCIYLEPSWCGQSGVELFCPRQVSKLPEVIGKPEEHTNPGQLSSLRLTPGTSFDPTGAAGSLVSLLGLSDKALHFSLWGGCVVLGSACVISWGDGSLSPVPPL